MRADIFVFDIVSEVVTIQNRNDARRNRVLFKAGWTSYDSFSFDSFLAIAVSIRIENWSVCLWKAKKGIRNSTDLASIRMSISLIDIQFHTGKLYLQMACRQARMQDPWFLVRSSGVCHYLELWELSPFSSGASWCFATAFPPTLLSNCFL